MTRTQPRPGIPTPVVLMLVLRDGPAGTEVLLGQKLTGFGAGNVVAPGGKIEPGETALAAAVRELHEETSLRVVPDDAAHRATILFRFPAQPAADMDCQVFLTRRHTGTAADSRELRIGWHPVHALPADRMWQDAADWLPRIIHGERFTATVLMKDDNLGVDRVAYRQW